MKHKKKKLLIFGSCVFVFLIATLAFFVLGGSQKLSSKNKNAIIDENGIIYLAQNEEFDLKTYFENNEKYKNYANYKIIKKNGDLNIEEMTISSSVLGKSSIEITDNNNNSVDTFIVQVIPNPYLKEITGLNINDFDSENQFEYTATKESNTITAVTQDSNANVAICTEAEIKDKTCNFKSGTNSKTIDDTINQLTIVTYNDSNKENVKSSYYYYIINITGNTDTNVQENNKNIENSVNEELENNEITNEIEEENEISENSTIEKTKINELECPTITPSANPNTWSKDDINFSIDFSNTNAISYQWFTAQNINSKETTKFNWYLWQATNKKIDYNYNTYNGLISKIDTKNNDATKKTTAAKNCSNSICTYAIGGSGYRKINIRIYDANGKTKDCGYNETYLIDKSIPKIASITKPDAKSNVYNGYAAYNVTVNASSISPITTYKYKLSDNITKTTTNKIISVSPTKDDSITVVACNAAGNCSNESSTTLKKIQKFEITAKANGKVLKNNDWTNANTTLTVATENLKNTNNIVKSRVYDKATSKWTELTNNNKVVLTKEGKYRVQFALYDTKAKKTVTYKYFDVNIDKTKPVLRINNPYNIVKTNESGPIILNGIDSLSGIKEYSYKKGNSNWNKLVNNRIDIKSLGISNSTKVAFSVKDNAGNETIVNETVNPINNTIAVECKLRNTTGNKEITKNNYQYGVGFNSNPLYTNKYVSCTAKTNIKNAKISYKLAADSASQYCKENGKNVDCRNKEIASSTRHIEAAGTSKITFYAKYGNETKSIDVKVNIDLKAPEVPTLTILKWKNNAGARPTRTKNHSNLSSEKYTSGWSDKKVIVTPTSKDVNGSGIDHYEYTTTGATTNHKNYKLDFRNIENNGVSTIKYRACDKAGNCSAYSKPVTIKIDRIAPSVPSVNMYKWKNNNSKTSPTRKEYKNLLEGKYSSNSWSNKKIFTVGSSNDKESGIDHYEISVKGKATNQTDKKTTHWNIGANGESKIKWRACDKAGNCSVYSDEKNVKIDTVKATCKPTSTKTNTSVIVKPNCIDTNGSGISKIQVFVTKGSATWSDKQNKWYNLNGNFTVKAYGTSTLKFKAQDKSGNWSDVGTIKVTRTKPVTQNYNNYSNYQYNTDNDQSIGTDTNGGNDRSNTKKTTTGTKKKNTTTKKTSTKTSKGTTKKTSYIKGSGDLLKFISDIQKKQNQNQISDSYKPDYAKIYKNQKLTMPTATEKAYKPCDPNVLLCSQIKGTRQYCYYHPGKC